MSLLGVQRHGSGPLLVWLHGFTQTKDSAHQFRSILAGTNEVSDSRPARDTARTPQYVASLDETADLLAEVLPHEPFVLGGYSFGARVALHFALAPPCARHVASCCSARRRGIEDDAEREERRRSDDELADHVETIGAEAFLDEWLSARDVRVATRMTRLERAARSSRRRGTRELVATRGHGHPALARAGIGVALDADVGAGRSARSEVLARGDGDRRRPSRTGTVAFVDDAHHAAHLEQPATSAAAR